MPPSEFPVAPSGESLSQARGGRIDQPPSPDPTAQHPRVSFPPIWPGAIARLPAWRHPALVLAGGAVALDGLAHVLHPGAGLVLGLGALAGGWWMLTPNGRSPSPWRGSSLADWVGRCESLIPRFSALEGNGGGEQARRSQLAQLERERLNPELHLALSLIHI